MRQPDINRVKMAMSHIMSAIASIDKIKYENRTHAEETFLQTSKFNLADEYRDLRLFVEKKTNDNNNL